MQNLKPLINLILAYIICVLCIMCSSCSYKQNQVLFDAMPATKDSAFVNAANYIYRITPQDVLQIRNLQNINYLVENTSTGANTSGGASLQPQNFQVEEDGTVPLPVIGRVKVAGLSQIEAEKTVEDLYRKTVLKDPIIELKIISLKVTILGEVKAPGNYPLTTDRLNLVDLIGQAGGLTEKADEKQVKIVRGGLQDPHVTIVDMSSLKAMTNPALTLQSHDIVYIAKNKRALRNDKFQDIATVIQPALILLNTALIIYTLSK